MTNRIAVGTPVNVSSKYGQHAGRNDLVVLSDQGTGYGVGPKGNDPAKSHNGAEGWLYYSDSSSRVTPKEESKFKEGDKVEFTEHYMDGAVQGTKATVVHSYGEFTEVQTDDGERYTPYSRRLKLVEAPAFKVGDLVTFNEKGNDRWQGGKGRVVKITTGTHYPLSIEIIEGPPLNDSYKNKKGHTVTLSKDAVLLVEEPKPFTFKDIQKGDTIRRTATYKGATEVREGVVSTKGSYYWATEQGNYIIAYDTDGTTSITDVTLELLNRPEPEPTLLENTKIGDKLVIRYKSGSTKVYTKARYDGDCWDTLVIYSNGKATNGSPWSNTELEAFAASQGTESTALITK